MLAAVYRDVGMMDLEDVKTPSAGEAGLVVKVLSCGICGTDLRIFHHGHHKIPPGTSRILGHEVFGEIVELGRNVHGFRLGERVLIAPNIGCGRCIYCARGLNNLCPDYVSFGLTLDGGFAEYMAVPQRGVEAGNVITVQDDLSVVDATFVETLSCCLNGIEACGTMPGDTVVVLGGGPIGATHVLLSRIAGAGRVIASEIRASRAELLLRFGADAVIDPEGDALEEEVMRLTGGRGAEVVIVACSSKAAVEASIALAARGGVVNFFAGLPSDQEMVTISSQAIHYKQLRVTGTTGSTLYQFRRATEMMMRSMVDARALLTGWFPLSSIKEALEAASGGNVLKVALHSVPVVPVGEPHGHGE